MSNNTDNTLTNTLSTLIRTLTELKTALDKPQLDKAPDLTEYVKLDDLHDEVRDAMRDSDNLSRVAQAVWDDADYSDLAREIEQHLDIDVDDKVSEWFGNNFSASDYDLATHDYVDEKVSEVIDEKLDVERIVGLVKADLQLTPALRDTVGQIVREELRKILTKGLDE